MRARAAARPPAGLEPHGAGAEDADAAAALRPFPNPLAEAAFQEDQARSKVLVDVVSYLAELLLAPFMFGVRAMERFACRDSGARQQLACCALPAAGPHSAPTAALCAYLGAEYAGGNQFVGRERVAALVCGYPCGGAAGGMAPSFACQAAHMLRHGLPLTGLQMSLSTHDWSYAGFIVINLAALLLAVLVPRHYAQPRVRNSLVAAAPLVSSVLHLPVLTGVAPALLPPMPQMLLPLSTSYLLSAAHKRHACLYIAWRYVLISKLPTRMFAVAGLAVWAAVVAACALVDLALLPADGGGMPLLTYPTIAATFLLLCVAPGLLGAWREGAARQRWLQQHRARRGD